MKETLIDERDTENSAQCWELCSTKQVKKWLTTVQQAKRVTNQYEIFAFTREPSDQSTTICWSDTWLGITLRIF